MRGFARTIFIALAFFFSLMGAVMAADAPKSEVTYTVKRGDWLAKISRNFGRGDYLAVAKENSIANPDLIFPGQVLNIASVSTTKTAFVRKESQVVIVVHKGITKDPCALKQSPDKANVSASSPCDTSISGKTLVRVPFFDVNVQSNVAQDLYLINPGVGLVRVSNIGLAQPQEGLRISTLAGLPARKVMPTTPGTPAFDRVANSSVAMPPGSTPGYIEKPRAAVAEEFLMSEVVMLSYGPAHAFDGLNENHIAPRDAIAQLFQGEPAVVHEALLKEVLTGIPSSATLKEGDHVERMLTAEGEVFQNVLFAQVDIKTREPVKNLTAMCYVFREDGGVHDYVLLRAGRSANWFGEKMPRTLTETNPCLQIGVQKNG